VSAALRITGNGPLAVVGTGWKPFEHVFVNARIGAVTKKAWPVAGRSGYWRIVVRTAPIGCDRVVVTARGPRTGLLTARRMFGACPPPAA
jgi:hypothetical protein